jgi:hypothetical protein
MDRRRTIVPVIMINLSLWHCSDADVSHVNSPASEVSVAVEGDDDAILSFTLTLHTSGGAFADTVTTTRLADLRVP